MDLDIKILSDKKLLVGVTGSIAVAGLPQYLTMFRIYFEQMRVIMTSSAEKMIPAFTVSLFADEVYTSDQNRINHVELAKWADIFILLPATANTLGLVANGIANNFLTSTILAFSNPLIIFPNMNELMWNKKVVQRNIKRIEEDGHIIVQPIKAKAYEVSSRSIQTNLILPSTEQVLQSIINVIKK